MSKHFPSSLICGLAFAMALPMAAAGTTRPVVVARSQEQAPKAPRVPGTVHTTAPRTARGQRRRRPAVRAKSPRAQHPIDLNTASATELMQLPRVGMGTADLGIFETWDSLSKSENPHLELRLLTQ